MPSPRPIPNLDTPIVLAPMAGGPGTVGLAAAVGRAGAFPFLPFGYLTAEQAAADVAALRASTGSPFGVNVFVPGPPAPDRRAVDHYVTQIASESRRLGVEPGEPRWSDDAWDAKLALILDERPDAASFTFGCPDAGVVQRLRDAGIAVWMTVTSPAEARRGEEAGADVLVVQGIEAGGHQGRFFDDFTVETHRLLPLLDLVRAQTDLPLVAAGGIATRADVEATLARGAAMVQAGTAFLLANEAATHPAQRVVMGGDRPTQLTRAFTGRTARGIVNEFIERHEPHAVRAYPEVHFATAPLRAAARAAGDAEHFNLWAGESYGQAVTASAAEIVGRLTPD